MIKKVLVANRGEIAVRILRACKDMGIKTVAIHSDADSDGMHVNMADERVCVGGARSKDSYLNKANILQAAKALKVDAVHPGYGFLAEDVDFARQCAANGIIMIGPTPQAIELLGNKSMAKETAKNANCPTVPGSDGALETIDEAKKTAKRIGYPVMLKAVSGGGGRGIRRLDDEAALLKAFEIAKNEAFENFGDGRVYLEKCIINPKHIEVQLLADHFGSCVYLFERNCSMQRRHQKFIEEAPAPNFSAALRKKMGEAAVRVAKFANFTNAGTIEFLLDSKNNFYFMEMNTRVQVEHTITEEITGVDIVREQIRIASNQPLSFSQKDLELRGHAIECRINAEDPSSNFKPCAGLINFLNLPGGIGVRVDTAVFGGYFVPPYYDSMIAKLVCWGATREDAIARTKRALSEFVVKGIKTNIPLLNKILENKTFIAGDYDIDFLEKEKILNTLK